MKRIFIIGLVALTMGCGRRAFSRPGSTEYEFAREYLECSTPTPDPPKPESQDCRGPGCAQVHVEVYSRGADRQPRVSRRMVYMCMRAKGWVLERGGMYRP